MVDTSDSKSDASGREGSSPSSQTIKEVCTQIHKKGYICTLDPGHEGKHKAEDLNNDVICEW